MPCTSCMNEFTRFRKEHGCSSCSFSFCATCLPQKIVLPQLSKQPVSVCQNCYDKLTRNSSFYDNKQKRERHVPLRPYYEKPDYYIPLPHQLNEPYDVSAFNKSAVEDRKLEERLKNLRKNSEQEPLSVNEIEKRLAKLRGADFNEVYSSSLLFMGNRNKATIETAESLLESAKMERDIEKKWSSSCEDVEQASGAFKKCQLRDSLPEPTSSSDDILLGDGTIRNLKKLKKTLASFGSHDGVNDEMEKILNLTKQKSLEAEKINAEMGKFWERNIDSFIDTDGTSEFTSEEAEDPDLKEILAEAEKVVNEEKELVKESKKRKKRFFSKFFRSVD